MLEQLGGLLDSSRTRQRLNEPERARDERALSTGKPIAAQGVPPYQVASVGQLRVHSVYGPAYERILRRRELEYRQNQQRCIELLATELPDQIPEVGMHAVFSDGRRQFVASAFPTRQTGRTRMVRARDAQCAVRREPRHQLRVHKLPRWPRHLPDAAVGLRPTRRHLVGEPTERAPRFAEQPVAAFDQQPRCVQHPAVAIKLMLISSVVADSDGAAVGESGPWQFALARNRTAIEGEHGR